LSVVSRDRAEPTFFATPAAFRRWLKAHHARRSELWVGFYKKGTGRPSITWPEAVDEALCVGWIDSIRRSIDSERYAIRFTPRKPGSTWSVVNQRRMAALLAEGRVLDAGAAAFERRHPARTGTYSYENRGQAALDAMSERAFRAVPPAWAYFSAQAASYRQTVTWWVVSAKRPETRARRLAQLIECSRAGEWIPAMRRRNRHGVPEGRE
jgi:uncharacterized protein YdeI (YjbR/CyaY-like superfamily)